MSAAEKRPPSEPDKLNRIVDDAAESIRTTIAKPLSEDQESTVRAEIERAVIRSLLEGQNRAVDACLQYPEADWDMAHKLASTIRAKNDVLISNLSSMR